LIDNYKVFPLFRAIYRLVANQILEFDDLFNFRIGEPSFRLDKLFALFRRRIKEPRVDFTVIIRECELTAAIGIDIGLRLLVFQANIQGQDVSVFDAFGHVRMSGAMI
jgi:hypothetical protein